MPWRNNVASKTPTAVAVLRCSLHLIREWERSNYTGCAAKYALLLALKYGSLVGCGCQEYIYVLHNECMISNMCCWRHIRSNQPPNPGVGPMSTIGCWFLLTLFISKGPRGCPFFFTPPNSPSWITRSQTRRSWSLISLWSQCGYTLISFEIMDATGSSRSFRKRIGWDPNWKKNRYSGFKDSMAWNFKPPVNSFYSETGFMSVILRRKKTDL